MLGEGLQSRWLECLWPVPCFLEALLRCWMQPEAMLFASLLPVCLSFLEVFVLFWGKGGRRLHWCDLPAGVFRILRAGPQGIPTGHCLSDSWDLIGAVEKNISSSSVMHLLKKKKKAARETSQYSLAWRLSAMGFPTGRSHLAQYPYCFYILLQIESYASEISASCSCGYLCLSGAFLLHARKWKIPMWIKACGSNPIFCRIWISVFQLLKIKKCWIFRVTL